MRRCPRSLLLRGAAARAARLLRPRHAGLSKHHAVYVCRCCFASPRSTAVHAAPASRFIDLRTAGSMQQSGVGAETAGCRPRRQREQRRAACPQSLAEHQRLLRRRPARASLLVGAAISWRPPGGRLVLLFREGGALGSPVTETHGCSDQRRGPENRLPGSLAARSAHRRAVSVAPITPRSDHRSGEIAVS